MSQYKIGDKLPNGSLVTSHNIDMVNSGQATDGMLLSDWISASGQQQSQALASNPNIPVQGAGGGDMIASTTGGLVNYTGNISGTSTPYVADQGLFGRSNLDKGQTVMNSDGTTTTGGYLWDSTTDLNYNDFNKANGGNVKLSDYNDYAKNQSLQSGVSNGLGYVNAAIGLGGLAGNLYYAEQNKRAQEDARDYAKSRDAMADAKTDKFQSNLV